MITQQDRATLFKKLHIKGNPLILFNIWDAGSAQTLQEIGAKAIATSSWSVAAAQGYEDGEKLPLDWAIANLKRILNCVDLPVTVDVEGGYGRNPVDVQKTITKIVEIGAVGLNFEDQIMGQDQLYSIDDQCARLRAVREAAVMPVFINARTDIFLQTDPSDNHENHVEEAIQRAKAYAKAGADGFFIPGLKESEHIKRICELSPIPVNVMVLPATPELKQLEQLGVSRISYGPTPYVQAMDALKEAGRKALSRN